MRVKHKLQLYIFITVKDQQKFEKRILVHKNEFRSTLFLVVSNVSRGTEFINLFSVSDSIVSLNQSLSCWTCYKLVLLSQTPDYKYILLAFNCLTSLSDYKFTPLAGVWL